MICHPLLQHYFYSNPVTKLALLFFDTENVLGLQKMSGYEMTALLEAMLAEYEGQLFNISQLNCPNVSSVNNLLLARLRSGTIADACHRNLFLKYFIYKTRERVIDYPRYAENGSKLFTNSYALSNPSNRWTQQYRQITGLCL